MMPNFLLIGAPRSGTTTLYQGLRQHPEIYMSPNKEPWFFACEGTEQRFEGPGDFQGIRDRASYEALFDGVRGETAIGEASTLYLSSPKAVEGIKRHVPDAKLLAVLRNPVERAYSNYMMHIAYGRESLSMGAALDAEDERMKNDWSPFWFYSRMGLYSDQLARYFGSFPRDQIRVYLYEDLEGDLDRLYRSIFRFLGVDDDVSIRSGQPQNPSGVPRSRALWDLIVRSNALNCASRHVVPEQLREAVKTRLMNCNLEKVPLRPHLRQRLADYYRDDILRTQELLDRDLSDWLEMP